MFTRIMATDYYVHEPSAHQEAIERWENEGGRLQQQHRHSYDSIGKDYQRQLTQKFPIGWLYQQLAVDHAILSSLSKKRSVITGQTQVQI